jgi:hypothetical protein
VAKALGLSRTALYRRLERHGLARAARATTPDEAARPGSAPTCWRCTCRCSAARRPAAAARPLLFVGAEALLLASLALGWRLVRRALEPLGYTRRFHDLLQDQQYANRLAAPGGTNSMTWSHVQRHAGGPAPRAPGDRRAAGLPRPPAGSHAERGAGVRLRRRHQPGERQRRRLLGWNEQPLGKPLRPGPPAPRRFDPGLDARARTQPRPGRQLDALALGDSRLLTDTEGRRYRAQRGRFFDRGFARHFLMVEELTAELEDSERATYARLIRVLAHEVNNTVAATGSVLDSLLFYRSQLAERDAGDFAPPSSRSSAATQPGRVHRPLHQGGQDAGAGTASGQPARTDGRHPVAEPRAVQCRGIQLGWGAATRWPAACWTCS